jgi:hypothetical protein
MEGRSEWPKAVSHDSKNTLLEQKRYHRNEEDC